MPSDIQFFLARAGDLQDWPDPQNWLCNDEIHRYVAMGSSARRLEFIKGHWLMRLAIGYITGRAPDSFAVQQPEKSPPLFTDVPGLVTSLSHCKGWLGLLVLQNAHTPALKIGIDIETERARPNLTRLAGHSFGADWLAAHESQLLPQFFQRWTRCEAVVKASHLPLGTQLLRGQIFTTAEPRSAGLWVYHHRWVPKAEAEEPLHLSIATPYPVTLEGHCWSGDHFQPVQWPFSTARAPLD